MSTDFTYNNTTIGTTGGIKPNVKDTPGDARTRVETYADIKSIPTPYVGLKITVKVDETNDNKMTDYIVKSLKANSMGIANSAIDEVVRYADYLGVSSSEGLTTEQINQLTTAYEHSQSPHVKSSDIPAKVSDLENDSGFVNKTQLDEAIAGISSDCHIKRITIEEGNPTNINTLCASINSAIGTDYQVGDILTGYANLITLNYGDTSKTDSGTLVVYIEDNGHSIVYLYSQNDGSIYSGSLSGLAMGVNLVKIGEIDLSSYQTQTDNTLTTTDKTVIGAINELKLAIDTKIGEIGTILDSINGEVV